MVIEREKLDKTRRTFTKEFKQTRQCAGWTGRSGNSACCGL